LSTQLPLDEFTTLLKFLAVFKWHRPTGRSIMGGGWTWKGGQEGRRGAKQMRANETCPKQFLKVGACSARSFQSRTMECCSK